MDKDWKPGELTLLVSKAAESCCCHGHLGRPSTSCPAQRQGKAASVTSGLRYAEEQRDIKGTQLNSMGPRDSLLQVPAPWRMC